MSKAYMKSFFNGFEVVISEKATKQGYIKDLIRTDIALDSLRHAYKGDKQD